MYNTIKLAGPSRALSTSVVVTVACFAMLTANHLARWTDAWFGWRLPSLGNIALTLVFTGFSISHANAVLGKRRTAIFFIVSALVSWTLEELGVLTGWVYGKYHYSDLLGPKLGAVPVIIPLAWFMMIYPSWIVAQVLLNNQSKNGRPVPIPALALAAAMVMTSWDVVMDPGMSRSGNWVWETGGSYFGVPMHNFAGWIITTLLVYLVAGAGMRRVRDSARLSLSMAFNVLPVAIYTMMTVDNFVVQRIPELRIVDLFTMGLVTLLAWIRLAQGHGWQPMGQGDE